PREERLSNRESERRIDIGFVTQRPVGLSRQRPAGDSSWRWCRLRSSSAQTENRRRGSACQDGLQPERYNGGACLAAAHQPVVSVGERHAVGLLLGDSSGLGARQCRLSHFMLSILWV